MLERRRIGPAAWALHEASLAVGSRSVSASTRQQDSARQLGKGALLDSLGPWLEVAAKA
jgi:hypothetical protein